jgi:primary-amine oxidase
MHDHSLQFKADLDIAGVKNTMMKHTFIPVDVDYKWSNVTKSTMKLAKSEVKNEDEGRIVRPPCLSRFLADAQNWAHNSKELVLIVNKDSLNKYGEERGYKIMPSRGPPGIHQTITNSTNLQKSGATGTHGYFVTKHVSPLGSMVIDLGRKTRRNALHLLGTPTTPGIHLSISTNSLMASP